MGAARWRVTAAPSASRGTGRPTRSSVASASGCWPWSLSPNDDLPSSSSGRGGGSRGAGLDLGEGNGDEVQNGKKLADKRLTTEDNVGCLIG